MAHEMHGGGLQFVLAHGLSILSPPRASLGVVPPCPSLVSDSSVAEADADVSFGSRLRRDAASAPTSSLSPKQNAKSRL